MKKIRVYSAFRIDDLYWPFKARPKLIFRQPTILQCHICSGFRSTVPIVSCRKTDIINIGKMYYYVPANHTTCRNLMELNPLAYEARNSVFYNSILTDSGHLRK